MKENLIIIGGSGSLIDDKNKIGYDYIYPTLIMKYITHLKQSNLSQHGNDVLEAVPSLEQHLQVIKPKIAIIDLGLVDCSPRVFTRKELTFLLTLPEYIQKLTYGIQKKHRRLATRMRNIVYVPLNQFYENYRIIIEQCMVYCDQVCVLTITRPTDYVCYKSFKMLDNIVAYNEKIKELAKEFNCEVIDVFSATENDKSLLANDGYHLSEKGHHFIYQEFHNCLNLKVD